jgi:hypothetical protein
MKAFGLIPVSAGVLVVYFAYLRLLMKINQPIATGTETLWKAVLVLIICQIGLTIVGLRRKWNSQWFFCIFPFLILMSLTGAIYLQWFMVSVKGSLK